MKRLSLVLLLMMSCGQPTPDTALEPVLEPVVITEPVESNSSISLTQWKTDNAGDWTLAGSMHGVTDGVDYTTLDFHLKSDTNLVSYSFKVDKLVGPPSWNWPNDAEFIFWYNTRKD